MLCRLLFITFITFNVKAEVLKLEDYLLQVESTDAFSSGRINEASFLKQEGEGSAIYIPNLFVTGAVQNNELPNFSNNILNENTKTVTAGVNFLTPIGFSGSAYFQTGKYDIGTLNAPSEKIFTDTFGVSVSQEFWKNGFGKTTRSKERMVIASKRASSLQSAFQNKQLIYNAKLAFWNLGAKNEMIKIIDEGIKVAYEVLAYTKQKYEMGVFEKADLLKFEFLAKQLEFLKKQNVSNLELSVINFNSIRGLASSSIEEDVIFVKTDYVKNLKLPEMNFEREDVKALKQQMESAKESYNISLDAYAPSVTLSANISNNGLNPSANTAINQAKGSGFVNKGIALNISVPLGSVNNLNDGYKMAQVASKKGYEASVINAKSSIINIQKDFDEILSLILMQEELVKTAKEKLTEERRRYKQGRTTSLQLYLEEQDYINSQLSLVNLKLQALQIYALSLTYSNN